MPGVVKIDHSIFSYLERDDMHGSYQSISNPTLRSNEFALALEFSPISLQLESSRYSFVHMIPAIEIISRLPCPCSPGY